MGRDCIGTMAVARKSAAGLRGAVLVVALVACSSSQLSQAAAYIPDAAVPPSLLSPDEGISTSLADTLATGAVPDTFTPDHFEDLEAAAIAPSTGFVVTTPGAYQVRVESYCLHIGRRAPQHADSYAYLAAPLKGRLASIIGTLVNGRRSHPEVAQQDVQLLIWGLLLNTKVTDLTLGPQRAAVTLLSASQLAELEAIPVAAQLTGDALDAELAKLPEPIQQLRRTEDRLRSMLQSAATSYADVERLAAPDAGIGDTKGAIPAGRWSTLDPGVFVRFVPNGYTQMAVQVYIPKPLLPAAQPFHARPFTAVPYAPPFVLLLGGTVAVPSFSGQRLAASNVPVGNPAPPPSTGQKVAADVKNGHCGGMPVTGLDPALDQSNFREGSGDPTTDPNSTNISLPPNTLTLLDGSIMDPGNAPGWATLYHELMHAAIQLYGVGPPPNPAWQDFVRDGTNYFKNAPMEGGGTTSDPFGVFSETAGSYVGERVATYVGAMEALHRYAEQHGCPVSPAELARVAKDYDQNMARANHATGYDRTFLGQPRESTREISPAMKSFIDNTALSGKFPDKFADAPGLNTCNLPHCPK